MPLAFFLFSLTVWLVFVTRITLFPARVVCVDSYVVPADPFSSSSSSPQKGPRPADSDEVVDVDGFLSRFVNPLTVLVDFKVGRIGMVERDAVIP